MIRECKTKDYNWKFDTKTGSFARWGKTWEENPEYSELGMEILDIEVSTVCHGLGTPCSWCYKSNNPNGKNMSFETFKKIFDKLPDNLMQVALGIGDIGANKDLWKIMEYCRSNNVIPNITINGYDLKDEYVKQLAQLTGAVAVSCYNPKDFCYNAVKRLTDEIGKEDNTLNAVNIHKLLAHETMPSCIELFHDYNNDDRLKNLNAIVFLSLKKRGDRNTFKPVNKDQFEILVKMAFKGGIPFGFDSCTAYKLLNAIKNRKDYKAIEMSVEPCESLCFSGYIACDGKFSPCSFCENHESFGEGINVLKINDFKKEVWQSKKVINWRNKLLNNKRKCFVYDI